MNGVLRLASAWRGQSPFRVRTALGRRSRQRSKTVSFHPFAAPAAFAPVPAGAVGFAEPDWKGDADFDGLSEAIDLDGWLSDLADEIADGARRGWLTAYQARRAGFDLQSIRC